MPTPIRLAFSRFLVALLLAATIWLTISNDSLAQSGSIAPERASQNEAVAAGIGPNDLFLPLIQGGGAPLTPFNPLTPYTIISSYPTIAKTVRTTATGETCVTFYVQNASFRGNSQAAQLSQLTIEHEIELLAGNIQGLDASTATSPFVDCALTPRYAGFTAAETTQAAVSRCTFTLESLGLVPGEDAYLVCRYQESDNAELLTRTTVRPEPFGGYDDNFNQLEDALEDTLPARGSNTVSVLILANQLIGEAERQQVRDHAGTVEREFPALNMLQATLPAQQITPLVTAANGGADPWITMLGEDAALPTPPYQTETRSLTEAGAATGSGMPWTVAQADRTVQNTQQLSVAVLDTGLDSSHAALTDRIVSQYDAVTRSQNQAADRDGHGSHVAGIIAGVSAADGFTGIAAGVDLVNVRIGGDGVWRTSNIVDGIDWLIRHKTDQHTVVINNSNTYVGRNNPFWTVALRTATEAGLVVVTAAGDGFDEGESIGAPAGVAQAVTVGAANSKRQVTYYSSRGQADKEVIKPDVLAPADNIRSVQAAGQTSGGSYQFQSGTSTATPFVTGMAALLVDRLTDAIRGVADNDARIDEDGWDGIDNDGDNLIDEDPGPWGYSAAEVRLVKSLILMTTAQALGGETVPAEHPNAGQTNVPIQSKGTKNDVEGFGHVELDAALEAVTEEFCGVGTATFGVASDQRRVWARHLQLYADRDYTVTLEGPEGADYDLYLYRGQPNDAGEPVIARRPGPTGTPIAATTATANEEMTFRVRNDGVYFLVVRHVSGAGDFIVHLTDPQTWTLLLYMPAELAGGANLDSQAAAALNAMETIGSGEAAMRTFQVIALVDFDQYNPPAGDSPAVAATLPGESLIYCIRKDRHAPSAVSSVLLPVGEAGLPAIAAIQGNEANMGDPNTLVAFAQWGIRHFPADHYGLILWGDRQGYGWKSNPELAIGPGHDTRQDGAATADSSADALDLIELDSALASIRDTLGDRRLDILGFDMGQMATLDVLAQLADSADFLIAPETPLPGQGWPYQRILAHLRCSGSGASVNCGAARILSAATLATQIVSDFGAEHGNAAVLTAFNLRSTSDQACLTPNALVGCLSSLADGLLAWEQEGDLTDPADNGQLIIREQVRAMVTEMVDRNFVDMVHLMELLRDAPLSTEISTQAAALAVSLTNDDGLILAQSGGSDTLHGLSLYFPTHQLTGESACDPRPGSEPYACSYENPYPSTLVYSDGRVPDVTDTPETMKLGGLSRPALNGLQLPAGSKWDEFLLDYYQPHAVACTARQNGPCVEAVTARVGDTVSLSALGSSDTDATAGLRYYWDLATDEDHAAPLPTYAANGDQPVDEPCTEDCDRDGIDSTDDDPDFTGPTLTWTCTEPNQTIRARLMVHDDHNIQPTLYDEAPHTLHWGVDTDQISIYCAVNPQISADTEIAFMGVPVGYDIVFSGNPDLTGPSAASIINTIPALLEVITDTLRADTGTVRLTDGGATVRWQGSLASQGADTSSTLSYQAQVPAEVGLPPVLEPPMAMTSVQFYDGLITNTLTITTPVVLGWPSAATIAPGESVTYTVLVPSDPRNPGVSNVSLQHSLAGAEIADYVTLTAIEGPPTLPNVDNGNHWIIWDAELPPAAYLRFVYRMTLAGDLPESHCDTELGRSFLVNSQGEMASYRKQLDFAVVTVACAPVP